MARVAHGEIPLFVEIHGAPEIRVLLEKTEDFGRLRMVLVGATEAGHFLSELAERRIPVVVQPEPARIEGGGSNLGSNLGFAAKLDAAGVPVLFGSGGRNAAATRDLPTLVGLTLAHGLDHDAAFSALTVDAAAALDVGDRLGTVEVGKDADLLVLTGDPLSTSSRVRYGIVAGDVVVERN